MKLHLRVNRFRLGGKDIELINKNIRTLNSFNFIGYVVYLLQRPHKIILKKFAAH